MLKKLVKPILICGILLGLYALSGFYLLPYLLKTKLPELISEQTKTPATLNKVEFNPFKLELTLSEFDLKDKQKQSFVKFSSFFVDINVFDSIKNLTLVVEQIRADQLQTQLTLFKDGKLNYIELFPPSKNEAPEKEQGAFPVFFKQVQLNQGAFTWVDQRFKKPESETITPINLTLTNLSFKKDKTAKVTLAAQLDVGGKIDWDLELSPKPMTSKGHIQFKGIKVERLWALLLQDQVNFKIPQGESDISVRYDLAYATDKLLLQLSDGMLAFRKLQFTALNNAKPLINIPELTLNGIAFDLAKQSLTIADIQSNAVNLSLLTNAAGELNVQRIFAPKSTAKNPKIPPSTKKTAAPDAPWLINIAKVGIHKLQAEHIDQREEMPIQAKWGALDFKVTGYQLHYAEPKLQMQAKNAAVSLQNIALNDFHVQKNTPPLNVKLAAFQTDLANFKFDAAAETLQITADNGKLHLQDLNLLDVGPAPALISFPEVTLNGARFDLAKQKLDIASLQAKGAKFRAWLNKEGELNYQALFAENVNNPKQATPEPIKPSPDTPPWTFSLAELGLQNFQFDIQDKSRSKPVELQLSALNLKAQQLSNQKGQKLPFTLSAKINTGGTLDLKGQAVLEPFSADIQTTLNNLGLNTFQPYLNDYARVDIIKGGLNTSAKISLSKPNAKAELNLSAKGSANIKELVTRDQVLDKDLIKWRALKFDAVDFKLTPLKLTVGNILLQEPYARVTIKEDHSLNFNDLVVKQPAQTPKPKSTVKEKSIAPQYQIAAVTIDDGTSDFSDFSLILPFVVELNELNGAIKGFSSANKKLTDFSLAGKVFDLSPMEMEGNFSPDFSILDIGMHFKGMPLPFISPYMVEFAGYKIEKGKMSLDLLYKITDRKLAAENKLVLDQLTLGEKVENPKATSLPLNLAITLLKDSDGKININLPLTGSLDDPQFSVTSLIFDAFVNMLTKVISSPFKALGALTSSDADLSQVSFKEGSNALTDAEQAKLQDLAKALTLKPELSVEIKGRAYTKEDWPALQDDALLDQLKALKAAELKAGGKNQLAEYVELSQDDYLRLLADLFIKKFPHLGKRSFFGTPELIGSDKDFETVAKQQLAAIIPPDKQRLGELAATRARNIAQNLIQKGKITHARIFILDGKVLPQAPKEGIISELALTVQ